MSKSSALDRLRHAGAAVAGFVVSLIAVCAAAPAAFAMRLPQPDDSGTAGPAVSVAASSGIPGWEIALITIGAVMLVSLLVVAVLRMRRPSTRLQRAVS